MRQEKKYLVTEVEKYLQDTQFVVLADHTGLDVGQTAELRKRLLAARASMHVVKNTIFHHAAAGQGLPALNGALTGPTTLVTGADIGAAAKVLKNFAAEFEKPKLKAGILDGKILTVEELKAIADLPSRESLLAQLMGLIQTPATQLARLLNEPASMIARVARQKAEQGEKAAASA